jgi:hypothetical protein
MRRDTGRRPTLGDLLHCESCQHYSPLACAVPVIQWGADTSSDKLRQFARCTACGRKSATLQHRGWPAPMSASCLSRPIELFLRREPAFGQLGRYTAVNDCECAFVLLACSTVCRPRPGLQTLPPPALQTCGTRTGFSVLEPSMGGKWLMAPQTSTGRRLLYPAS